MFKKFLRLFLSLVVLAGMAFLFIAVGTGSAKKRSEMTCSNIKVNVLDSKKMVFVDSSDVANFIKNEYGEVIGQHPDSVNLGKIERILLTKGAILSCEAYITDDACLNIDICQREPALRLKKGEVELYADVKGFLYPVQKDSKFNVPLIEGEIPVKFTAGFRGVPSDEKEQDWICNAIGLAKYINKSKIWRESIDKITVLRNGDICLVPKVGKEKFIFGQPVDVERKFNRIQAYYERISPSVEIGYYRTVNVKYDGQIICRK